MFNNYFYTHIFHITLIFRIDMILFLCIRFDNNDTMGGNIP